MAQLPPNSPASVWDAAKPTLQTIWDATSLASFMACPTRYKLGHIDGWSPKSSSVDLHFGSIFGDGMETFYKAVIEQGLSHEGAQRAALLRVHELSYDPPGAVQRFGSWEKVWRCTGTAPFRNEKGNKAKCPYSHAGKLYPGDGPAVCGKCGSEIERREEYMPLHPVKDRRALLRLIYQYTEEQRDAPLKIMSLEVADKDGKMQHMAMAEVPWVIPFMTVDGVTFSLSGWFDTMKNYAGTDEVYITDLKTTKHTLGASYFAQYNPNTQVSVYAYVGARYMKSLNVRGVAIEAFQLTPDGVRSSMRLFDFTPEQHKELEIDLLEVFTRLKLFHDTGVWPKNRTACFLCPFKQVCGSPPEGRIPALQSGFERSRWNPLLRQKEPLPPLTNATILPFKPKEPVADAS